MKIIPAPARETRQPVAPHAVPPDYVTRGVLLDNEITILIPICLKDKESLTIIIIIISLLRLN